MRKITKLQFAETRFGTDIFALCNDDSAWMLTRGGEWEPLPLIPQTPLNDSDVVAQELPPMQMTVTRASDTEAQP